MNALFTDNKHAIFAWPLRVKVGEIEDNPKTIENIRFMVEKLEGKWKIDATHIEAALSLWIFHIHETEAKDKNMKGKDNDWLRKDKDLKRKIIRLIGPGESSKALRRDIKWWIRDLIGEEVIPKNNVGGNDQQSSEFGPVGFLNVESGDETSGNPHLVQIAIIQQ
jgi:hypothetical protein